MGPVKQWLFSDETSSHFSETTFLCLLNLCVGALNFLAVDFSLKPERLARLQREVVEHVASRVGRFLNAIHSHCADRVVVSGAFSRFQSQPVGKYPKLEASAVDLPLAAGTCNPQHLIPTSLATAASCPESLFSGADTLVGTNGAQWTSPVGAERRQYLKLAWRQLCCGKTRLRRKVMAVGDIFSVAKSGNRQREVWNGSAVSACAVKPPAPTWLANPSCFVDLVFEPGRAVYMSKRDVHTCFDVLAAPSEIQPWFGRPPVSLAELSQVSGSSVAELQGFVVDVDGAEVNEHQWLFPASTVWPMGFSWSSCIARASTVACCLEAGVAESAFLCMEVPPPKLGEACGVATDDTFCFHVDKDLGRRRLEAVDKATAANGMPKNSSKDVTLQASKSALGCELTSLPGSAEPSTEKLIRLFLAWLDVLTTKRASPQALNRALGVEQWFCLLSRPMFSILSKSMIL